MKLLIRLYLTQLKQYIKALPLALLGSLIFILLTGAASVGLFKYFTASEDDGQIVKATVGVVVRDIDDEYLDMGINMLGSMASTSDYFTFKPMEEDEAEKALSKGKIIAIFDFPENAIDGILSGANDPVNIRFNQSNPLSSVLLTELTRSGATLLSGAQAGTYTTADLFYLSENSTDLYNAFVDIDNINFKLVLKRGSLFNDDEDEESSGNATILYYAGTAIILVLVFFGLTLASNIYFDNDSYLFFGKTHKGFEMSYFFSKIMSLSTVYYFISLLLLFTLSQIKALDFIFEDLSVIKLIFTPVFIALFIASMLTMLMYMMPRSMDGILLSFIVAIILTTISGLLIPLAFMPAVFIQIHNYLPFTALHMSIVSIYRLSDGNILPGIAYIALFLVIGYMLLHNKIKRIS